DWHAVLLRAAKTLATCRANAQHRYSDHLRACPWCSRVARGIPDPFPPLRDGQSAAATASPPSGPSAVKSTGGPRHGPRAAGALTFAVVGARSGGKTTTVINLGACLADVGWKTLIVDLSASSEATTGLGIDAHRVQDSIYELLVSDSVAIRDVIKGD